MAEGGKVVVSIVERDGKILLVHRKTAENGLTWSLPGGKVEHSESERSATRREVREEVGIRCTPTRRLGERLHPDTNTRIAYWVCHYVEGEAFSHEPDKIDEVRWLAPQEVYAVVTSDVSPEVRQYLDSL